MADVEEILSQLKASATSIAELDAPPDQGVYGFFLAAGGEVPHLAHAGSDALYIGTSANLAQREFDTHFATGQSGSSTLRRSLGALMIEELQLKPQPRGTGASETNYRNYRFDDAGEERLSRWMEANLRVGVHAVPEPRQVETELIALACPPLNLTHWANPQASTIKCARKACVEAARAAERR